MLFICRRCRRLCPLRIFLALMLCGGFLIMYRELLFPMSINRGAHPNNFSRNPRKKWIENNDLLKVPDEERPNRSKYLPENRHIVFVKVHKAASTTMQNLLLRFAMSHELNILLMKSGPHVNEQDTYIDPEELLEHPEGMKFDVLCGHIIFDRTEIAKYFPETTVYIGIVREPFQQFRSAFMYYYRHWHNAETTRIVSDNPDDPVRKFLRNPLKLISRNPRHTILNNRMAADFGFPVTGFEAAKSKKEKIDEFLTQIHSTFDLVLISDLFEESMVLLRRYMKWSIKDVLYLRSNSLGSLKKRVGGNDSKFEKWWDFTHEDWQLFKQWEALDYALYQSSLEIFHKKIKVEVNYGFNEELDAFRKIRKKLTSFCNDILTNTRATMKRQIGRTEWSDAFEVTENDCKIMSLPEVEGVDLARNVQSDRMKALMSNQP